MSRRRRSIRTRLTLAVGLMVGLLASVSAVAAYAWFAASLEQELEDFGIHETEEIAQVVAAVTSIDAGAREALMRLLPEDGVLSLEVWSLEGERVYAHPASIAEAAWPEGLAEARAGRLAVDREWREDGIDGVRVARLIRYGKEPRWIAVSAVSHAQTGALLAQARIFAGLGVVLHFLAFGPDPMRDKGAEGIDAFQSDRVARAVGEAEKHLAAMSDAILRAENRALERRVESFQATVREMFRTIEDDPRDLTGARKYLSVYLRGARDATVKFADLYGRTRDEDARRDYVALLDDLEANFSAQTEKLLTDNRTDLDIEIEVLRDRLAREGVRPE